MSLVIRGLDLSISQQIVVAGVIQQQNRSELLAQASQQGSFLIDYSVPKNRLYEKADGSIGLSEKSIGYVIGEQIIRPIIDVISGVWNSCFVNMIWGTAGSLITKNPTPMVASTLSCLSRLEAAGIRDQILNGNQQTRVTAGADPVKIPTYETTVPRSTGSIGSDAEEQVLRQAKIQLRAEVLSVIPGAIQKTLNEVSPGDSWFWSLLIGAKHFVLDVTQVSVPIDNLKNTIGEMEVYYWMHAVKPEYLKVFPKPREAWDGYGRNMPILEIDQMRTTLAQYGYVAAKDGTPLQFIKWFIQSKQCCGGWCNTVSFDEL